MTMASEARINLSPTRHEGVDVGVGVGVGTRIDVGVGVEVGVEVLVGFSVGVTEEAISVSLLRQSGVTWRCISSGRTMLR